MPSIKKALELLNNKSQSSSEGFLASQRKIINIKASMNKGLSEKFNTFFPNTIPVTRNIENNQNIVDPNWLVGFVDGEGCFYVGIKKSKSTLGFQVIISFSISQYSRDLELLYKISEYLNCGILRKFKTRNNHAEFVVYKFDDNLNKIIPFFQNYTLRTVKLLDYFDFCRVAKLVENKSHLTLKGIEEIQLIKSKMNRFRFI